MRRVPFRSAAHFYYRTESDARVRRFRRTEIADRIPEPICFDILNNRRKMPLPPFRNPLGVYLPFQHNNQR